MTRELHRLVYRSRACIAHDDVAERNAIFTSALANNRRHGITGCLAQPDGHFVQVIEGPKPKVDALLTIIRADERHEEVAVLGEWRVRERLFNGWAMARPDPAPMNQQAFRVCTSDGSGVQVTSVLLGLMSPGSHLYSLA